MLDDDICPLSHTATESFTLENRNLVGSCGRNLKMCMCVFVSFCVNNITIVSFPTTFYKTCDPNLISAT